MRRWRGVLLFVGMLAGLGMVAAAAAPVRMDPHFSYRPGLARPGGRDAGVGATAFFNSSDGGANWNSGFNTAQSNDGVLQPATATGAQVGEGSVTDFHGGNGSDTAGGALARDTYVTLGDPTVVVDRNGVPHAFCLGVLSQDVDATTQRDAILHYVGTAGQPPGQAYSFANFVVAHNSSETRPGFEDKPWVAYDRTRDVAYCAWTHFTSDNNSSFIEFSALANLSQATAGDATHLWSAPIRLDTSGAVQAPQMVLKTDGTVVVQWNDAGNLGGQAIDSAEVAAGGATVTVSAVVSVANFSQFGVLAPDFQQRIGPFPNGNKSEGIRINFFPSIALDLDGTDGFTNSVYTAWNQMNPNGGSGDLSDGDVVCARFDPTTLTMVAGPVTVNQNPTNDGTDQFMPSVAVSPVDGSVHVLYYDKRSKINGDAANTDVGASIGIAAAGLGSAFKETAGLAPITGSVANPIMALSSGFDPSLGDYVGIAALAATAPNTTRVYASWGMVDAGAPTIVDPVFLGYTLATGGSPSPGEVVVMSEHAAKRTRSDTCSEMALAVDPASPDHLFAVSNDAGDLVNVPSSPSPSATTDFFSLLPTPPSAPVVQAKPTGGCFIATAAYGSYFAPHVMSLRRFRDHVLLHCVPGRAFVAVYYRWSPPLARFIAPRPTLRWLTCLALTPLVFGVEQPGWAGALYLLLAVGMAWAWWRRALRSAR